MILKSGETRQLVLRNKSVDGLTIKAVMEHTTNNTAFSGEILDLTKLIAKVVLKRRGQSDQHIYGDIVKPWAMFSGYYNGGFAQIADNSYSILRAEDTSVDALAFQTLSLKFGGVINLKGDDELYIELNSIAGMFAATVDTATSHIEFNPVEAIGYEIGTPIIETTSISANESRIQEDLGDDVKLVAFINFDKTGVLEANTPISSVSLSSDRLSLTDNYYELLAKRADQFESKSEADVRDQCFMLVNASHSEVDEASLDLTLVSGNINTGKNYLVTQKLYVTPETVVKAARLEQKHDQQMANKINEK